MAHHTNHNNRPGVPPSANVSTQAPRVVVPTTAQVVPPSASTSGRGDDELFSAEVDPAQPSVRSASTMEDPSLTVTATGYKQVPGNPRLYVHESAVEMAENPEEAALIGERETVVRPKRTLASVTIGHHPNGGGQAIYTFTQGKRCTVPRRILAHLEEKGII